MNARFLFCLLFKMCDIICKKLKSICYQHCVIHFVCTLCVLCVYTSLMCSIYTEVGRLINFRSAVARQILFTSNLQKQILNKLSDNTICVNQGQECLYVLQST